MTLSWYFSTPIYLISAIKSTQVVFPELTRKLDSYAVRIECVYGWWIVRVYDVNNIVTNVSLSLQLLRIVFRIRQHRANVIHNFVTCINRVETFLARHISWKTTNRTSRIAEMKDDYYEYKILYRKITRKIGEKTRLIGTCRNIYRHFNIIELSLYLHLQKSGKLFPFIFFCAYFWSKMQFVRRLGKK